MHSVKQNWVSGSVSDDGGTDSLQKVGNSLHSDTADLPQILHCIQLPWKLQTLHSYLDALGVCR